MDTAGQPPQSPGDAGHRLAWLPMAEAVRRLGVSERTVRRRLASKELNARRAGRVTLIGVPGDAWQGPASPGDARHAAEDTGQSRDVGQEGALGVAAGDSLAAAQKAEVAALRAHNDTLRAQLDARTREVSELHVLLGRAQLAAPTTAGDAAARAGAAPREPRSWWRRLLGRR